MSENDSLNEADWEALKALSHGGSDLLPEGADLNRLEALGLVEQVGITWGITEAGRSRLAAEV